MTGRLCAAFLVLAALPASADSLRVALEPGFLTATGDGFIPLRVTGAQGERIPVEQAALAIEIEGARVEFEVASIEDRIAVLLDPSCLAESDRASWAAELARAIAPEAPTARSLSLFLCGDERLREIVPAGGAPLEQEIARGLNESVKPRLYDGILETIGRISSTPDVGARLALFVIGSGVESADSRHPVLTCIEAADSARVAVHALVIPAIENAAVGERRLKDLAAKSGGIARAGGTRAPSELRALLESVESTQVVRIRGLDPSRRHSVRVLAPGAPPATGALATRTSVGYAPDRPIPWMAVALGGFFIAGAVSIWVKRARPLGRLRVLRGASPTEVFLTRRGITIGGATGNGLVFDDPRVSRNHAMIQVKGSEIKLVDLKSSNGTKVNGARVSSHSLRDGDRILLAEAVELVYESRAWKSGRPEVHASRPKTRPSFGSGDEDDDNGGPSRERRT